MVDQPSVSLGGGCCGGVPDFPAEPAAAIGAFNLVRERMTVGGSPVCAASQFCLDNFLGNLANYFSLDEYRQQKRHAYAPGEVHYSCRD